MPTGFEKHRPKNEVVTYHYEAILKFLSSISMPVMSHELEKRFNINGTVVRAIISMARKRKEPVCSSSKGYWLTNDPDELEKNADSMMERANAIMSAVNGMRGAAFKLRVGIDTQYKLFES